MKTIKGADHNYIELDLLQLAETDKALLLSDGDREVWVTKSQLEDVEQLDNGLVRVVMPEWLAIDKELV